MTKSKFKPENKAKLNKAFQTLRQMGYIARQNFSCCDSCAGVSLAFDVAGMDPAYRDNVMGVVFYHKQNTDNMHKYGELMLHFGPIEVEGIGKVGKNTWNSGMVITMVLRQAGLKYEWDGKPNSCIMVIGHD